MTTALGHLLLGAALALIVPRFGSIFSDMLSADVSLPVVTRIVLALAPLGWMALGVCSAGVVIAKDLHPVTRRVPNWPFVVVCIVVGGLAIVGLWLPLLVIIESLR